MEQFVPSIITPFGYFHTALSILSMFVGAWAFFDGGRSSGKRLSGKLFYAISLVGIITGFTIFHHGGFGIGHVLSLVMLVLVIVAYGASLKNIALVEILAASGLYFLIWFFATSEALTRFPQDHPIANSPTDLPLLPVRVILFALLGIGIVLQYRSTKRR
jgi:hypothetical protein